MVPDVFVPQPPAETCEATDLLAQAQCGLGRKCTLEAGAVTCADAGDLGAWSPCDSEADACAAGTLCADPMGTGTEACLPFCAGRWSPCGEAVCAGIAGPPATNAGIFLCVPATACDPVGQGGCPQGQGCLWDPRFGDLTICVSQAQFGSGAEGASCNPEAQVYPCGPGLACVSNFLGGYECRRVCLGESGQGCGQDEQCTRLGEGLYGYCQSGAGQGSPGD